MKGSQWCQMPTTAFWVLYMYIVTVSSRSFIVGVPVLASAYVALIITLPSRCHTLPCLQHTRLHEPSLLFPSFYLAHEYGVGRFVSECKGQTQEWLVTNESSVFIRRAPFQSSLASSNAYEKDRLEAERGGPLNPYMSLHNSVLSIDP